VVVYFNAICIPVLPVYRLIWPILLGPDGLYEKKPKLVGFIGARN